MIPFRFGFPKCLIFIGKIRSWNPVFYEMVRLWVFLIFPKKWVQIFPEKNEGLQNSISLIFILTFTFQCSASVYVCYSFTTFLSVSLCSIIKLINRYVKFCQFRDRNLDVGNFCLVTQNIRLLKLTKHQKHLDVSNVLNNIWIIFRKLSFKGFSTGLQKC